MYNFLKMLKEVTYNSDDISHFSKFEVKWYIIA